MEQMKVLRPTEVVKLLSISKSALYRWIESGDFPKPIKLGRRASGWTIHQIEDWLKSKQQQMEI